MSSNELSLGPATTEGWRPEVDTTTPSVARVYDYLLGGKDNFAVDREAGDRIRKSAPEVQLGVQQQRAVLRRAVRYLVGTAGLRQLIDIGTGLPTVQNVHEVAHEIDGGVRVVYVDNDPIVLTHARALLAKDTTTIAIAGDLRRPAELLADPAIAEHLEPSEPVGLILCGILHHIMDDEDPWGSTESLIAALPSGSHVFIHHLVDTGDSEADALQRAGRGRYRRAAEISRFFTGLEMVEPGLVPISQWRPDQDTLPVARYPIMRFALVGLGRKP